MPTVGITLGVAFRGRVAAVDRRVAFALLAVGVNILVEHTLFV